MMRFGPDDGWSRRHWTVTRTYAAAAMAHQRASRSLEANL